jgi:Na+-driven multidrug efflux pump
MKKTLIFLVSFFAVGGAFGASGPTPWSKKVILPRGTALLRATISDNDRREILRGGGLTEEVEPLPTMRDYRKFALPCLALWVIGPMLSLIDTAFVGLSGDSSLSAGQIAALGPATTFFDGATYLFAFLNVASTNLYSSARAQYGETSPQAESVVRTAARSALVSGFCVMGLLLAFARPLLGLYIGE